jgi:hypothetical protein
MHLLGDSSMNLCLYERSAAAEGCRYWPDTAFGQIVSVT